MIQLKNGTPALLLAPMEGVTDAPMRALLTERGNFSFCVSEFYRVSQDVPKPGAIKKHLPELKSQSKTPSGAFVQLQFLGGNPERLAASAVNAVSAGAKGIDLNFGCPAPTVNKHDGGATLLLHPDRIFNIVSQVRNAVPASIAVSAKLRLGWDSIDSIYKNAAMAAEAGASWITVHARTKVQGYRPPAYWGALGNLKKQLNNIPIVANGEIWSLEDFLRCRDITRCEHFMIGRGALANPTLSHHISKELGLSTLSREPSEWRWESLFTRFATLCQAQTPSQNYVLCRIKQWITFATINGQNAWLVPFKRLNSLSQLLTEISAASLSEYNA